MTTSSWTQTGAASNLGRFTTATYTYPAAGTAQPHGAASVASTDPAGTSTSSFTYDASGNTTTRQLPGKPTQTLTWDTEGRLSSVTTGGSNLESDLYSADGDRILRRAGTQVTAYLPGGQELTLDTTTGTLSALRYYGFAGQTIAVRNGSGFGPVTSLILDNQGSAIAAIANATNALTRRYADPFGAPRGITPTTWVGDHGFLNKATDAAIGLTQVGARYLDTTLGRFISVDPVMNLLDPQQWNAYAYANNNPITWADPTGRIVQRDGGGVVRDKSNPLIGLAIPAQAALGFQLGMQNGAKNLWRAATIENPAINPVGVFGQNIQRARSLWSFATSSPGSVADKVGAMWSSTWHGTVDSVAGPIHTKNAFGVGLQAGQVTFTVGAAALAGGASADVAAGRAGATLFNESLEPSLGQRIFRVYGGDSRADGPSWSPVDPRTVVNYRDAAGLPSGGASGFMNSGRFVIEGTLNDPAAVVRQRCAEPLDGMKGGLPEYIIPQGISNGSITVNRVSGVNPGF